MIDRRFLDWNDPALPAMARALVAARARGGELDLERDLVVVPGARAGRRMVELLVDAAEERELVLTPPGTATVGVLPERLYEPSRPLADGVLSGRVWADALRTRPRERLGVLVPEPPTDDDLAGWAGLADIVQGLHYEVTREGHDFRSVAERCREGLLFDDSRRWTLLAEVRDEYLERLASLGRADRFEARIDALERGRVGLPDEGPGAADVVHLVGVVEMPGVVRRLLERIADETRVVAWVHAPEELADRFDAFGCVAPEAWSRAEVSPSDDVLAVRDGPDEQATEALRTLAGLGEAYTPDEVTVGVPDPEVVPWLEQRFRAHGVSHRVAAGTPLERTAPFRLLEAAADYLEGRRFADLAALLRHPALEGHLDGGSALETADRYHARHLPGRVEPDMPGRSATARDGAPTLEGLVERLHGPELLGPLTPDEAGDEERLLSGWMPEILALLGRVFGREPLSRGRPEERTLIEACQRIRDAAVALHRLPRDVDRACESAQAIRVLLAELRGPDAAVPPEPERAAVEMLGWLELHLDDGPALVVTGFNEGRVPESIVADPFLPNRLRSALGLQDDDARRARDAYLLAAILESRERVRIVAGRATGDGDPLRPSRLLLPQGGEALARRVLRFVRSDREAPPPVAPPGLRPADSSAFTTPPEPVLVLDRAPEVFSVTEFRSLLQDPYRWVLERRMGLEALHDEARELDPRAFGVLAHDVLERFAGTEEVGSTDAGRVRKRLSRLLDRLVEQRFGSRPLPAVPLQVEQLRRRLEAFADWHASRIESGWRVADTEVATPEGGVPFDVDGEPVWLRGRIDRIDVHRTSGAVAVFDYKTGDSVDDPDAAHRNRSGEWRDLQLPLYRHLLSHLEGPEGAPLVPDVEGREVRLGYLRLPKDAERVGHAMAGWDDDVLASAFERVRSLVRSLRERPTADFEPGRVRSGPWDPLAAVVGRGVLSLAPDPEDSDDDGEGR